MACGTLDVDGLLDSIEPAQWDEWVAFDLLEPVGAPRDDQRAAIVGAAICGAMGAKRDPATLVPWPLDPDKLFEDPDAQEISDAELQLMQVCQIVAMHRGAMGK